MQTEVGMVRSNFIFVLLCCLVAVGALFLRPVFPIGDPAVFEYIGRSIAGGAHLYTDLWDNKLPSIYYVNAFWWLLFGGNYWLHAVIEMLINLGTLALFASILRKFAVKVWAPATLALAIFYLLVGGPLDQTEHYATPLILAAILMGQNRRYPLASLALVVASTFWLPSIAVGAVPLLVMGTLREKITVLISCGAFALVAGVVFVLSFGTATTGELVQSWFSYQVGNYASGSTPSAHRYPIPFLSPRYYIESGLGFLIGIVAIFWKRDDSKRAIVAYSWVIVGVIVVFALGRPSIHYFLPLYPPLILLLAIQTYTPRSIQSRWYATSFVVVCGVLMLLFAVRDARRDLFGSTASILYTGHLVRDTFGRDAVGMLPWEIYLTADAVPPSRFFLAQGNVKFAKERDQWTRQPVVFVDARDLRFNGVPPPNNLDYVCSNSLTFPYVIHADRPMAGIECAH